jgi:HEAT repeat protein
MGAMNYSDRELLVMVIVGIVSVLSALTLLIILNKAWREAREAMDRRRRATLEPEVFRYAGATDTRALREYLPLPLSGRDERIVEAILLDVAVLVKGESRERITTACETLGLVAGAVAGLSSRRWWKRAESAEKLGIMRSKQSVDMLLAAMDDPEGEVRIRAAGALGLIRGRTSIRPIVRALADPSRWSAIRLAEILIAAGEEAIDELLEAYDGLPKPARISALDVIGRVRTPRAAALLRRSLKDPLPDVRARAAHAMGLIADPSFVDDLSVCLGDEAWAVRAMAVKALGRIGDARAVPRLAGLMSDREWWVRSNAGDALRALGAPGREALIRTLEEPDAYARHQAVAQLEEGGIIDEYVSDLGSGDPTRREAAIQFIRKVIGAHRIDRLSHQAVEHTQDSVRRALLKILRPEPQGGTS